jgi:hypothetical protein
MPILRWRCAHGEAPAVTVAAQRIVHLAPWDDSVDTNVVHITGPGEIEWFGWGHACTKRVLFEAGIILRHASQMQLLGLQDRAISEPSIGIYVSEGDGYWNEISFIATGAAEITRRLDAILSRLDEVESSLADVKRIKHAPTEA